MIKAVVFDFDGVIVESIDIKTQAFAALFAKWPEHTDAIVTHHVANMGVSRYEKFRYFYEELLNEPYSDAIGNQLSDQFSKLVFERVKNAPFVSGAKSFLKETDLPLFVASGTPHAELVEICKARGLHNFFNEINGSPSTKSEIVRNVLKRNAFMPQELVFVGDAETDYQAAADNWIHFILRRTSENLELAKICDRVVADLTELQSVIRELV